MENNIEILVPVAGKHLYQLELFRRYSSNIDGNFTFVGNNDVQAALSKVQLASNERFINEADGLFGEMSKRTYQMFVKLGHPTSHRVRWYLQQFIKMSYCYMTDNDYAVWDVDTIPLKKISFIDEHGRSLINKKRAHHEPYFYLIDKLFDGKLKTFNFSFITEAMFIRNAYMKEMIDKIGGKDKFIENIMANVLPSEVIHSGFSEFETYGTYVMNCYPDTVAFRSWKTERNGGNIFRYVPTSEELDAYQLSADLDTISFELPFGKWQGIMVKDTHLQSPVA